MKPIVAAHADGYLGESSKRVLIVKGTKGLARRRHVSHRTLQRRLAREGTSPGALLEEERKTRLLDLLRAEVPLKDVASQLGLAGTQVLSRFVKRLFGKTPGELRKSL